MPRRKRLFEESVRKFRQSGIENLINEFVKIQGYEMRYGVSDPTNSYACETVNCWIQLRDRQIVGVGREITSIGIKTAADGAISFIGGPSGSTTIKETTWEKNRATFEQALEKAYKHPTKRIYKIVRGEPGGPCLPGNSPINTPNGLSLVKDLQVGDLVWTVDGLGQRVQVPIIQKTKRPAARNHKMAHVILKDGRELVVSLGHPTIDYKEVGSLVKGDNLDMSYVTSIKVIPYKGKYTYDILPSGDTGGYWANNILIGSTLSDQFQRTISDSLYKLFYLSA